jgi:hypothetical protein
MVQYGNDNDKLPFDNQINTFVPQCYASLLVLRQVRLVSSISTADQWLSHLVNGSILWSD